MTSAFTAFKVDCGLAMGAEGCDNDSVVGCSGGARTSLQRVRPLRRPPPPPPLSMRLDTEPEQSASSRVLIANTCVYVCQASAFRTVALALERARRVLLLISYDRAVAKLILRQHNVADWGHSPESSVLLYCGHSQLKPNTHIRM